MSVVDQIIDPDGQVVEERLFATWEDLCEPPAPVETRLRSGRWIKYRAWIPADEMAEIQRKARVGGGRRRGQVDDQKFMMLILEAVLLEPKINTARDRHAASKMDSSVMLGIINQVVDTSTFERLEESMGEA